MGRFCHAGVLCQLVAVAFGFAFAGHSLATAAPALKASRGAGYERVLAIWPEADAQAGLRVDAAIKNGVLVARFSAPLNVDPKPLIAALSDVIALARMDADHKTLRLALRRPRQLHVSHSYNVFALDLLPPNSKAAPPQVLSPHVLQQRQHARAKAQAAKARAAAKAKAARPGLALPLKVRSAQTSDYARIAFDWTHPVGHALSRKGNAAELTFDRPAVPDLSRLNADPPRGLIAASSHVQGSTTLVNLDLVPGMQARMWQDGNKVMVDIFGSSKGAAETKLAAPSAKKIPTSDSAPVAPPALKNTLAKNTPHGSEQPPVAPGTFADAKAPSAPVSVTPRIDPTPPSGTVHARVSHAGTDLQVIFDFAAPVGSAAFRRADTIWIVFDDDAALDLGELEHGARRDIKDFHAFRNGGATGVRFKVLASTQIEAMPKKSGAQWTFSFGDKINKPPKILVLHREADGSGPGKLVADLPNVTGILSLPDPAIGDVLRVATGLGPPTGVPARRHFVEVNVLPSSQGLAFEVNADDVQFKAGENRIEVHSKAGLMLTPSEHPLGIAKDNHATSSAALQARTATPGFIDFKNWSGADSKEDFNTLYDARLRNVAKEATDPQPRIALARFLVANGMAAEALGMLSLAHGLDPMLVQDARFRALRGTANLLMHRIKSARADFSAQTLNRDPSAALWRGYLATKMQDWGPARREFDAGREAFYLFVPRWQARFRTAYAQAALHLNDLGAAKRQLDEVFALDADQEAYLRARLVQAAYVARTGNIKKAIRLYQGVADAGYEPLETRALFGKARLQIQNGDLKAKAAANVLEDLRYRWRGDNTELEEVLTLGKLYSEMHDYRRALESMNTAVLRFPDSPVTRRISEDMHRIFNTLFLHGGADDMDPVKALALFYQFIDLVPIGADGDRMLRRLADRLVDFDLLPQATNLLQHQVDKRIRSGLARAKIASKLALLYLMDHKPEKALIAIRKTRRTRLPMNLNHERRLIETRAYMALGDLDKARDLIETDRAREGALLRADIAWQTKNWQKAGPIMLKVVQRQIPVSDTLNDADSSLILRTAIALNLSHNRAGVIQLRDRYAGAMTSSKDNDAFVTVTSEPDLRSTPIEQLAPALAQTQDLQAMLQRYRDKFEGPAPKETASAAGQP